MGFKFVHDAGRWYIGIKSMIRFAMCLSEFYQILKKIQRVFERQNTRLMSQACYKIVGYWGCYLCFSWQLVILVIRDAVFKLFKLVTLSTYC